MSIKSSSRLSVIQASASSRPSMIKTPRTASGLRPGVGSTVSLLWPGRGSALYRTGKTGFKVPRYQNSYRLNSFNPFNCETVEKILQEVMDNTLKSIKYNPAVCLKLCQDMSSEVRSRIYKKDFDRYKYVVIISIYEKTGQALNVATGRLGDVKKDTYCSHIFENSQFISLGNVFATYYE